jgi:translation initiation factor 2B subunit (eIF-2B alpha/beta/delta family)
MAKKPQKDVVEELVKNLVDSEISGIQALAKDMAERIKQLEEHSVRIKEYADEIEKLAMEAASDKYDKASLDDLINNLEKTLTKLRKKQTGKGEITSVGVKAIETVEEEVSNPDSEEEDTLTSEISEAAMRLKQPLYTTPEGFVVRKTRK